MTSETALIKTERDELLAALQSFVSVMAEHGDWDDGCFYYARQSASELQAPIMAARAILAKATAQ